MVTISTRHQTVNFLRVVDLARASFQVSAKPTFHFDLLGQFFFCFVFFFDRLFPSFVVLKYWVMFRVRAKSELLINI